jgi:ATP-dependent DNA helicase RecG
MRSGDSVVPMPDDHLRAIFAETEPDFSSLVCQSSSIDDLSPEAIESFRKKWHKRSGNANLVTFSDKLLLQNAELVEGDSVTNAALILLAKTEILRRIYPQCEIIFEYRLQEVAGPANERLEIRSCAIEAIETLWNAINKRNDLQSIQDGLLVRQVQTFNEAVVREALLNAITHRDYSMLGPIFVVQYPRKLVVKSPGGFPRGVTIKNLIDQHIPRNRRLAETFERVGFVEKAGQGVDRMFELAIREGKNTPDYGQSDEHQIILAVEGELIHPDLVRFIESVGEKTGYSFSTVELLALAAIHGGARGTEKYPDVASKLCEKQIIERVGKGRGTRYILSKAFYTFVGRKGTYTRTKRLDRDTNKALLLKHLNDNSQAGSPLRELMQVLPQLTKDEVRTLLRELRSDRKVVSHGRGQKGRWFPFSKVENEN